MYYMSRNRLDAPRNVGSSVSLDLGVDVLGGGRALEERIFVVHVDATAMAEERFEIVCWAATCSYIILCSSLQFQEERQKAAESLQTHVVW